jgi:DNA-binding NarL/FixJ family response regulator
MINLIIADDHPIFIDGLKTVLADVSDIQIAGEALNGKQVLELLKTVAADIVLLDIKMPELDGIETARLIKKKYINLKMIMLTQFGEKRFITKCLEIGVQGYLLKDSGKDELTKALKTVYEGGSWFKFNSPSLNDLYSAESNLPKLTANELKVLKLIVNERCNNDIAQLLNIEVNTVKSYKERPKEKTGSTTIIGLVRWAVENNMV